MARPVLGKPVMDRLVAGGVRNAHVGFHLNDSRARRTAQEPLIAVEAHNDRAVSGCVHEPIGTGPEAGHD